MHPGGGFLCTMKGKIGPRPGPSGSSGQIRVFSKKSPKMTKIVKKNKIFTEHCSRLLQPLNFFPSHKGTLSEGPFVVTSLRM